MVNGEFLRRRRRRPRRPGAARFPYEHSSGEFELSFSPEISEYLAFPARAAGGASPYGVVQGQRAAGGVGPYGVVQGRREGAGIFEFRLTTGDEAHIITVKSEPRTRLAPKAWVLKLWQGHKVNRHLPEWRLSFLRALAFREVSTTISVTVNFLI